MIKMILSALVALTATFATPAMAQVTPPSHVKIFSASLGQLDGRIAPLTIGRQTVRVTLFGCEIRWNTGQEFYVLSTVKSPPIVIRKDLMDFAWEKLGQDWDIAYQALVDEKLVCLITPVE
jgi:hypothetical protein